MAGVTISGTEYEFPAVYFDSREDAGELLDPLLDNAETEEVTKAKLKELDRLAEFGVYETVGLHTSLGKKPSDNTLISGPQERRNQGTICCERVQG